MGKDLAALLAADGIQAGQPDPETAAAMLASWDGGNHYQARASLPGGRIIVAGVHAWNRTAAAADIAAVFGTDPRHWTATKIKHSDRRNRP